MNIFDNNLNWYKGNLHTHTTTSDGLVSPEESIGLYKKAGYDFLALTDHRKAYRDREDDGFLIINGSEFHINDFSTYRAYHITGIGIKNDIYTDDNFTPQEIIDAIIRENGIPVIAHPYWSLLTHDDLMKLHGYAGIEIWNTVSETRSNRGDSTGYADVLASKGITPLLFAVDDTHFYSDDLFGGYIMVNGKSLSREDIMQNIRNGRFYCSQGPEFRQISIEGNQILVKTTPVTKICFMSNLFYCDDRVRVDSERPVTEAVYSIRPYEKYIRVECTDEKGRKAWSQIINLY